jgi:hypothetical protein
MLEAMGMKRLISHNATPTTINTTTIFSRGICCSSHQGATCSPLPRLRAQRPDAKKKTAQGQAPFPMVKLLVPTPKTPI